MPPSSLDVKKLFGVRLVSLRKVEGWSQEELSLRSGLARSYLSGVERGRRNISIVNIDRLSSALGVTLPVLMDIKALPISQVQH